MEKRTLAQIESEIEATKKELLDVHGTETEVYARIVGYYRAVKHWNNGKKDEYNLRKMFTLEDSHLSQKAPVELSGEKQILQSSTQNNTTEENPVLNTESVTYQMYTRKTCPNCPPVKAFMSKLDLPGTSIDVDTPEGLAQAAKNGVFASPTVIFYNNAGIETARCHNVEELQAVFNKVFVEA